MKFEHIGRQSSSYAVAFDKGFSRLKYKIGLMGNTPRVSRTTNDTKRMEDTLSKLRLMKANTENHHLRNQEQQCRKKLTVKGSS